MKRTPVVVKFWGIHHSAATTLVGLPVLKWIAVAGIGAGFTFSLVSWFMRCFARIMVMNMVVLCCNSGVPALMSFVGSIFAMVLIFAMIAKEVAQMSGKMFERIILQYLLGLATS